MGQGGRQFSRWGSELQHSSGDRRLDLAARKQVLEHWRFRPAMQDGHTVQAIGLVPIAFNLQ